MTTQPTPHKALQPAECACISALLRWKRGARRNPGGRAGAPAAHRHVEKVDNQASPMKMLKNMYLQWASYVAAGVVFVALYMIDRISGRHVLSQMRLDRVSFSYAVVFTATLVMFMYLFITYDKLLIPGIVAKLSQYRLLLLELSTLEKIYVSLLAGVSEELLFRGLLQPMFGLTITSVLFGLAHWVTFEYVVLASGLGFFFGTTLLFSDNLLVPIAVHSLYNIFAFRMLTAICRNMAPNQAL